MEFKPVFEMAIRNADKGKIEGSIVEERLAQFAPNQKGEATEYGKGYPCLVSSEPFFLGKARLFPNSVMIVGADTAVRLIDVKYYDGLEENMIKGRHTRSFKALS